MTPESKKTSMIRILEILRENTDYDHKLTHKQIIDILQEKYGLKLERKAVSNNIEALQDIGYDIIATDNGTYMNSHEFEDSELRLLIDGVLCSKHITAKHSEDIIERLCNISNKYFKSHIEHIHSVNDWSKTENYSLFYNIEMVDEAINGKMQLAYDYNKYGVDKKLHKSSQQTVSPYQLILHNQRYYLMAYNEYWGNMSFHRLDHITNMAITDEPATPIKKVPGYEKGIDYKRLATSMPYMFADELENIVFTADIDIVDQIVDWFGNEALIKKSADDDSKVVVSVKASPNAMEHWAMQYLNAVEITAPDSLRERIKTVLESGIEKYNNRK